MPCIRSSKPSAPSWPSSATNAGGTRLEPFGSAARTDFDPARSDLDFLVEFGEKREGSALDPWFGLKNELESMFERPVDRVSFDAIVNPCVRASIRKSRQLVYGT